MDWLRQHWRFCLSMIVLGLGLGVTLAHCNPPHTEDALKPPPEPPARTEESELTREN